MRCSAHPARRHRLFLEGSTDGSGGRRWLAFEREVAHRVLAMSMNNHTPDFGAVTNFEGDEATIALSGTFEYGAASELRDILDAAIDRHHYH